mgnify:CR=1 FL=1
MSKRFVSPFGVETRLIDPKQNGKAIRALDSAI